MPEVYRSDVIRAPAARVWQVIRDFNALPLWTPFVAESRIEGGMPSDRIGCVRNFRLREGGEIREQLIMLDDEGMGCTYSILSSPMAVRAYRATLRLMPVAREQATFAEWQATFQCPPAEAPGLIRLVGDDVFAAALAHLRRRFGGGAP